MSADREFVCEYNHKGAKWGLSIWADDEADAVRKLRSIGANGRVVGHDPINVPVPGWLYRLLGMFK